MQTYVLDQHRGPKKIHSSSLLFLLNSYSVHSCFEIHSSTREAFLQRCIYLGTNTRKSGQRHKANIQAAYGYMLMETVAQNFHEQLSSQDWQIVLSDACNGIKSQINPDCVFKSSFTLLLSSIVYNPRQTLQYLLNTEMFVFTLKKYLQYRKTMIAQSYLRKLAINAFIEILRYIKLIQLNSTQSQEDL